jgi:hypothetical protein
MKHGIPLRTLQQRRREDALKLKVLRLQIKVGVEALDRGELAEIADVDLEHTWKNWRHRGQADSLSPVAAVEAWRHPRPISAVALISHSRVGASTTGASVSRTRA